MLSFHSNHTSPLSRPGRVSVPCRGKRGGVKRKRSKYHVVCDPDSSGSRKKTYVVASDLSEGSGNAVEQGIGTILRDGDKIFIITVVENENKVFLPISNPAEAAQPGRVSTSCLPPCPMSHLDTKKACHILDIIDHNKPCSSSSQGV